MLHFVSVDDADVEKFDNRRESMVPKILVFMEQTETTMFAKKSKQLSLKVLIMNLEKTYYTIRS